MVAVMEDMDHFVNNISSSKQEMHNKLAASGE